MEMKRSVEFFKSIPPKKCSECGAHIYEQAESYLMECDRCLTKKEE
ncbi:protein YhfH [Peribacillus tepidiphilus]|nr:protein YhfH [Peribacillus tepidiphilus]